MLKLNTTGIILSFTMKLVMWGHLLLLATSLALGGNIGVIWKISFKNVFTAEAAVKSKMVKHRNTRNSSSRNSKMVKHRNIWWEIKTRSNLSESGQDYERQTIGSKGCSMIEKDLTKKSF